MPRFDNDPDNDLTALGAPRCKAARSDGLARCKNPANRNMDVCRFHGGNAPSSIAAAAARQRDKDAEKVMTLLWNPDAEPVTDPTLDLARLMGSQRELVETLGSRLLSPVGGDCPCCGRGPETDRAELAAHQKAVREYRTGLTEMERIGIADRAVKVQEAQMMILAVGMDRLFAHLQLTDAQQVEGRDIVLAAIGEAEAQQVIA